MVIKKIHLIPNENENTHVCEHDKKGLITDENRGEIICGPCGQVLLDGISISQSNSAHTLEDFLANSHTGPKISLTIHDKGLSTSIGTRNIDFTGKKLPFYTASRFKSMRIWDNRSKLKTSSSRNLISALTLLDGVKQKLGLTSTTVEHIAFIYRKASSLGLSRGRGTTEMMAASIYAACREQGIPRTMDEISDSLNVTKKRVSKCYTVLVNQIGVKPELANPLDYLSKFCSVLGVSEKTKRNAFNIIKQANATRVLSGSNPAVVCAGALYMACIKNDEYLSQIKISEMSRVSPPSIRKAFKTLNEQLMIT